MNTNELIPQVRLATKMPDGARDWSDTQILVELDTQLQSVFQAAVVNANSDYWTKQVQLTLTSGTSQYRLPSRSIAGATAIKLDWSADASLDRWLPLTPVDQRWATQYEGGTASSPRRYELLGDYVKLLPAPNTTSTLRITYSLRPSALKPTQTNGRVTAVGTGSITINAYPLDYSLATPIGIDAAFASGSLTAVDVLKTDGWHLPVVVDGVATSITGSVITFAAGTDLTRVAVGDAVRATQQSDWPAIPNEYHAALVDMSAARILSSARFFIASEQLISRAKMGLDTFKDMLNPRITQQSRVIKPQYGIVRRRGRLSRLWWP
jgi:hypothetical protein